MSHIVIGLRVERICRSVVSKQFSVNMDCMLFGTVLGCEHRTVLQIDPILP